MGKGSRAHVSAEWCVAMGILSSLDELKTSTERLQAFADCKLSRGESRIIRQVEKKANALLFANWDRRLEAIEHPYENDQGLDSPFDELVSITSCVAGDSGGALHQAFKQGLRVNIYTSPEFYVEIFKVIEAENGKSDGRTAYLRQSYHLDETGAERMRAKGLFPSPKCFSLLFDQIEALAEIVADSSDTDVSTPTTQLKSSSRSKAGTNLVSASEDNNAGNLREKVPALSDQLSVSKPDGCPDRRHDACEKIKFQGNHSRLAGRSLFTLPGADHDRPYADLYSAFGGD
jgi:hypothetical protein